MGTYALSQTNSHTKSADFTGHSSYAGLVNSACGTAKCPASRLSASFFAEEGEEEVYTQFLCGVPHAGSGRGEDTRGGKQELEP